MKWQYGYIILLAIVLACNANTNNSAKKLAINTNAKQLYDIQNANGIDTNNYEKYPTYNEDLSLFGSKYIRQFNSDNQMFRFVNTCDTNTCNNIKLQQLEYGKWKILKLNIVKDAFEQAIIIKDINYDMHNDIVVKHKLNSHVYLYNPSYNTFLDTFSYTINNIGPYAVDINNNLFCDFRYLKFTKNDIASELYYLNGNTKTLVYQMVFAAIDTVTSSSLKNTIIDKMYLQKIDSSLQITKVDTIKIKPLLCDADFHEQYHFVEYWKKNYIKLLNIKNVGVIDREALFNDY